jgi:nucleoside-diphosphate-sugar epimerase
MRLERLHVTRALAIRVLADAMLVQTGLIAAYVLRFQLVAVGDQPVLLPELAEHFLTSYARAAFPMGAIAFVLFGLSGFYTNGRFYRGNYRYLWVFQTVALAYVTFAALAFMANNWFQIPRGVVPLGFGFTALIVAASRFASRVWASVLKTEGRLQKRRSPAEIKVETVLVIGGAGYIGSALLPLLLERGYRVRLLDLLLFGDDPIRACVNHPNLEVLRADFRQIDRIVEAIRGVDAVIHLGGLVGDPACAVDEALTIDINLTATRFIAEVARGEGIQRFIFASTCSVYGSGDDILDEQSELRPLSLYARTKLASEKVLLSMAGDDFAPVILRFGTIYGLSGRTRFDLVVNLLTAKAITDGRITVFGGDQWRPFVHVRDAARAVFTALQAPLGQVQSEIFNVGSDKQNLTISQVGKIISDLVPTAQLVSMGSDTDLRNYRVSFAKIRSVLGFEPEWTIDRGVRQVQEALTTGIVQNYADARYSNLKSLTEDHNSKLFKPEQDWPMQLLRDSGSSNGARESTKRDDVPAPTPLPTPAQA